MHKALALTLAVAVAVTPAIASASNTLDGNHLLKMCTSRIDTGSSGMKEAFDYGVCMGFIAGSLDYVQLINEAAKKNITCVPDGVTAGQAKDIVVKYLQNNPEKRHEPQPLVTIFAFQDAFPCSQ
ncbi:Rap1a/Tai family immunity protein [Pedomonas sp. V897]|uniref:Rap1a/Tai family immunity protein n=1 Tax=Pedomonas sp. V897 TaxID=3446482 RepID=UPI003EDF8B41